MSTDYQCPKCKTDYEGCGNYEDDCGEQECAACGFRFVVKIEYEPSYEASCVVHEFGEPKQVDSLRASFCIHCGAVNPLSIESSR